jgi:hypothetical protein
MKLFDVVRLTENLPEKGLQKGMVGTVVALFDTPEAAYEVEFANDQGETLCEVALTASQLELYQPTGERHSR